MIEFLMTFTTGAFTGASMFVWWGVRQERLEDEMARRQKIHPSGRDLESPTILSYDN